jgi:4-amino-4-deoxy-L-arabinose transferase-like glycosyltransferase
VRLTIWALAALLWFGTLGIRPLYKADESRYGEISREMAASGDWVTPRLNGFKYFEKPPLQYWATAFFFKAVDETDWTARLWTALLGFAGLLLVLYAGNRLFGPPTGWMAAAVLAGSPLYVLMGQINTLDMGVTFFLSAAMFALVLGHTLVFWAACAAAVLSKGLIGIVLPLATVALYILVKRDLSLLKKLRVGAGGALFLAIAAPWFVAVSVANPEFLHFFFVQEHFERFTTEMHHRAQPAWYFLAILAAGMAPWLLPLARSAFESFRARRPIERERNDSELLLWIWAAVVLAFFSASSSKLPPYILPMVPAAALLAARALTRGALMAQALVLIPLALGIGLAIRQFAADGPYERYAYWLVVAALILAASAAAAFFLSWRNHGQAAVLALAFGGLASTQVGLAGHRTLSDGFSVASTVAVLPARPAPGVPVFAVDMYDHTLPWSLKRTVTMVAHRDELAVAIGWEPEKFVPNLSAFAQAWNAAPQAWAFVSIREVDRLSQLVPLTVMAGGPQYAIVRKP